MDHTMHSITADDIASFRRSGYVHLESFFSSRVVRLLKDISNRLSFEASSILKESRDTNVSLADRARARPFELIVIPEEDNPAQVCRYEFMIGCSSLFRFFVADYLQDTISALVGQPVVPFKDKTNEKLPGGGAFRPHQDFAAHGLFKPRYYITALLSIDSATSENGCVQFATNFAEFLREHKGGIAAVIQGQSLLHYENSGPTNGDIRSDIAADLQWQGVASRVSDLVLFDSFVPHWSRVNRSDRPRRAVFVTFNLASEGSFYHEYYSEKRLHYHHPKFHMSTPTSCRQDPSATEDLRKTEQRHLTSSSPERAA